MNTSFENLKRRTTRHAKLACDDAQEPHGEDNAQQHAEEILKGKSSKVRRVPWKKIGCYAGLVAIGAGLGYANFALGARYGIKTATVPAQPTDAVTDATTSTADTVTEAASS